MQNDPAHALQRPTLAIIRELFLGKIVTESRSPAGNFLGFTLENIERGMATISLPVKKELTNPFGNIHGGAVALIMDEVIGWTVLSLESDTYYTSLNLNVDFLYAAALSEKVFATATVVRHGKKIVHVDCVVKNESGTLIAKATSNLIATGMKP